MDTTITEEHILRFTRRLLAMEDTGIKPGQFLKIARDTRNISREDFAELFCITTEELTDIEECRVPFPTMLLMLIFIYGVPRWFYGKEN